VIKFYSLKAKNALHAQCTVQDNERRGTKKHRLSTQVVQRRVNSGPYFNLIAK